MSFENFKKSQALDELIEILQVVFIYFAQY